MCSKQPTLKPDSDEEACTYAAKLFSITALPATLKAAIQLDLFKIISRSGPNAFLSPEDIAAQLPTQNPEAPDLLDRLLRLLASYNIVTCSVSTNGEGRPVRLYAAAPVCKFFTKNDDGVSLASLCLINNDKVCTDSWDYLKDMVLEGGIPFNKDKGMSMYEYIGTDQRFRTLFNEGMRGHSTIVIKNILEHYKGFDDVKVLVDVGGGTGASLNMIVSKHPHLRGINYDLPVIIAEAPTFTGIEHVSGDMFSSIPTADAIFLKWILHNWGDEESLRILINCRRALLDNGKVIVVENILPLAPEATPTAQGIFHYDVIMRMFSSGGKVRTEDEFATLAEKAGFSRIEVLPGYSNSQVIEFYL